MSMFVKMQHKPGCLKHSKEAISNGGGLCILTWKSPKLCVGFCALMHLDAIQSSKQQIGDNGQKGSIKTTQLGKFGNMSDTDQTL